MSIFAIYSELPNFPPTDQHPDAERYLIGDVWVDASGGKPTPEEVAAIMDAPISAASNGKALDERQHEAAKSEAAALASAGDFRAAFKKLLEII